MALDNFHCCEMKQIEEHAINIFSMKCEKIMFAEIVRFNTDLQEAITMCVSESMDSFYFFLQTQTSCLMEPC